MPCSVRELGFWVMQRDLYLHLTGRLFTSVILTEASPLALGLLDAYWLVPLLTLGLLLGSLYALLTVLMGAGWTRATRLLAAAVVLALWLLQNPSVAESVYWFNGLPVYTVPTAVLVFWVAALVRCWQAGWPPCWGRVAGSGPAIGHGRVVVERNNCSSAACRRGQPVGLGVVVGRPPALGVGRGPGLVWSGAGRVATRTRQYGAVCHHRGARVVALGTGGLVGQLGLLAAELGQ